MYDFWSDPRAFIALHVYFPCPRFPREEAIIVEFFLTSPSGPIQLTCGGGFPSTLQRSVSLLKFRAIRTTVAATEMKHIKIYFSQLSSPINTNPRTQRRPTLNVDNKVLHVFIQVVRCDALICSILFSCDLGYIVVETFCFVLKNWFFLENPGNMRCRVSLHDSSKRHIVCLINRCATGPAFDLGFVCRNQSKDGEHVQP